MTYWRYHTHYIYYTMVCVTRHVIGSRLLYRYTRRIGSHWEITRSAGRSLWWPAIIDYIGQLHIARMGHRRTHASKYIYTIYNIIYIICTTWTHNVLCMRQIEFRAPKNWTPFLPNWFNLWKLFRLIISDHTRAWTWAHVIIHFCCCIFFLHFLLGKPLHFYSIAGVVEKCFP